MWCQSQDRRANFNKAKASEKASRRVNVVPPREHCLCLLLLLLLSKSYIPD
jgi:hypothetical protein